MTGLTPIKAFQMMTPTIHPTGRTIEAIISKQKTADRSPKKIRIPTRMVSQKIVSLHYRNVRTNKVIVVIPIRMMENVAREGTGARSR